MGLSGKKETFPIRIIKENENIFWRGSLVTQVVGAVKSP
jgi:hypothetical protein